MNEQVKVAVEKLSEIAGIPLQIKECESQNFQVENQEEVEQLLERLTQITMLCKEISSEEYFFRSLLLGNPISDDYIVGKKFLPSINLGGFVFVITSLAKEQEQVIQTLRGLYPNKHQQMIISMSEQQTILICFQQKVMSDRLQEQALIIATTLNTEAMCMAQVAVGSYFQKRSECFQSFQHALLADEIGRRFYEADQIHVYSKLGMSRLIFELPQQACDDYLEEIFQDRSLPMINEETLLIVEAFFRQNLNVSETSRQLFMHRNTLLHKLDRIQETTGLDIRNFQDAITMRLVILLKKKID
mgnify:CR=1 FL=1